MTPQICERESALVAALGRGTVPEELARHAENCSACAEAKLIWSSMSNDALQDAPLPPAGLIWWKAQLESRRQLANRSVAAIDIAQKAAAGAAAVFLAALTIMEPNQFPWQAAVGLAVLGCAAVGVLYAWSHERI